MDKVINLHDGGEGINTDEQNQNKMNSTSRSGFDAHHQRLMQKRSQLSKLTRDQFESYVSSKEKFVEISKRLGVDQNLIKKDKEIKKRDESSPDAPKDATET